MYLKFLKYLFINMYDRGAIMTENERLEIERWVISAADRYEILANNKKLLQLNKEDTSIPKSIFDIKKRIEEKENLHAFEEESQVKDFIIVVFKNGFIQKHKDRRHSNCGCSDFQVEANCPLETQCPHKNKRLMHARFNVYIQVPPENKCDTYYEGFPVTTIPCHYVLSRSEIDLHWSNVNKSDIPRISLSFGYLLPCWKLNELCKDFGIYKEYPLNY